MESQINNTTIRIPTPLRAYTEKQAKVELNGATVNEALRELTGRYPSLHPHLFDENGALRSFVNLFLNGEDIRRLQGVDTGLSPGDKLSIIPAIAGG